MTFGAGAAGGPDRYKNMLHGNSRKFNKADKNNNEEDEPLSLNINNNNMHQLEEDADFEEQERRVSNLDHEEAEDIANKYIRPEDEEEKIDL